jgi:hypothetical protein
MKKFIAFTAILTLLIGCGKTGDKGELVGVKGAKWHPEKPYGMTLVPGGAYIMKMLPMLETQPQKRLPFVLFIWTKRKLPIENTVNL